MAVEGGGGAVGGGGTSAAGGDARLRRESVAPATDASGERANGSVSDASSHPTTATAVAARHLGSFLRSRTALLVLLTVACTVLQLSVVQAGEWIPWRTVFALKSNALGRVWTWPLSTFSHTGYPHLLVNLLGLAVFGAIVERTVLPTRRFLAVYLAIGVAAALTQVGTMSLQGVRYSYVGASGGIAGLAAIAVICGRADTPLFGPGRRGRCAEWGLRIVLLAGVLALFELSLIDAVVPVDLPTATARTAHLSHVAGFSFGVLYGLFRVWRR